MKVELFALVLLCVTGMLRADARPQQSGETSLTDSEQRLGRRYAESTIASDISKIMDSMVQKNFVNFLLNQREKKSMPDVIPEQDPDIRTYSDLLKKLAVCVRSKGPVTQ